MKKTSPRKLAQPLFFFVLGAMLFAWVYQDLAMEKITGTLQNLDYRWIVLSFVLCLGSMYFRAVRWKMLIVPLTYRPRTVNLFLSVLVLYFTNLIVPRGGEIARCGVLSKYEKIPFAKLVGTVFLERLADLIIFFILFPVVLVWQFPNIRQLLLSPDVQIDVSPWQEIFAWLGGITVLLGLLFFLLWKLGTFKKFKGKLQKAKNEFMDGLRVITKLQGKGIFIILSLLIFIAWLLMLYVMFFAYSPTQHLPFEAAVFAFTMGTFAYLLPIQAGIGVWHFIVIQSLLLFGIDKGTGMVFALVAHTFTNLTQLVYGAIGFVLFPLANLQQVTETPKTVPGKRVGTKT